MAVAERHSVRAEEAYEDGARWAAARLDRASSSKRNRLDVGIFWCEHTREAVLLHLLILFGPKEKRLELGTLNFFFLLRYICDGNFILFEMGSCSSVVRFQSVSRSSCDV